MNFGYHTIRWGWRKVASTFQRVLAEMSLAGFKAFDAHDVDIMPFANGLTSMPYLKNIGFLMPLLDKRTEFIEILSQMHLVSIYSGGKYIRRAWNLARYPLGKFFETRYFDRLMEFAASVGCELYVLAGPEIEGDVKTRYYARLAEELNEIGRKCNNLNIEASYHPHASTMVESRDQLGKLCRFIDPELVQLTFDTGHLSLGGVDLYEVIETYHERINHVQFHDIENGRFAELGEGTIDFPLLLKKLKSHGYDRWVIIEDEVNSPRLPYAGFTRRSPLQTARRSKKYIDERLT